MAPIHTTIIALASCPRLAVLISWSQNLLTGWKGYAGTNAKNSREFGEVKHIVCLMENVRRLSVFSSSKHHAIGFMNLAT